MDKPIKKSMTIDLVQQKLISSPLRIKIIYLLADKSMTAKQVADKLGKTSGSIHYHILQLYNGGILEIERTKQNKGITEKYYRSIATQFNLNNENDTNSNIETHSRGTSLTLTDNELSEFEKDLDELFFKYLKKTSNDNISFRNSYDILCTFKKLKDEE